MSLPFVYVYVADRQREFNEQYKLLQETVIKPNSKRLKDIYERVVKK